VIKEEDTCQIVQRNRDSNTVWGSGIEGGEVGVDGDIEFLCCVRHCDVDIPGTNHDGGMNCTQLSRIDIWGMESRESNQPNVVHHFFS